MPIEGTAGAARKNRREDRGPPRLSGVLPRITHPCLLQVRLSIPFVEYANLAHMNTLHMFSKAKFYFQKIIKWILCIIGVSCFTKLSFTFKNKCPLHLRQDQVDGGLGSVSSARDTMSAGGVGWEVVTPTWWYDIVH